MNQLTKKIFFILLSVLVLLPNLLMFPAIFLMPSALPVLLFIMAGPFVILLGCLAYKLWKNPEILRA